MPFGIVGRTGPGMRQVVGFGDRSTVMGTFGGEFGARHCPRGPTGHTCATAPRRGPLAKLLWVDSLHICIMHENISSYRLTVLQSNSNLQMRRLLVSSARR